MMKRLLPVTVAVGAAALMLSTPAIAAPNCEALTGLKLTDTTITEARPNTTGAFTPAGARSRPLDKLPPFCAVKGVLKPTPTSAIQFEVWLPESGWNGKLHVVGNGGLAGTISYPAMADALREGFATASTDTGHAATEPNSWLEDKERVIDYSYRGLHLTTVDAKAILQSYYSQPAKYAYYSGCSTGGKQGLMEAQRYPADFDGILAGDAANYWTHQMASEVWNGVVTSSPETNLPKEKLQLVQDRAIAACDMLDGAADGLVSNPIMCHFDPGTLLCSGADSPNCLTKGQVEAVRSVYSGVKNPLNGKIVYPGMYPGGEMGWASGVVINRTTTSGVSSNTFWSYALFHNKDWQFRTIDFARDLERADKELAPMMNATDPNLQPFQRLNHKLIYYHGAADPLIPAQNGIDYFETVVANQKSLDKTQGFYRAFLVPGLYHCSGGPGPIAFGTAGEPPAGQGDADHDIFKALERWVESGNAPAKVIATKYVDNDAAKGVAFQRPLCPHPQVATYKGSGDLNDASNFSCVAPK
jgi:Tannase and feruloyl esterase